MTKEQMLLDIEYREKELAAAKETLADWQSRAENNVFETLDKARGTIEWTLYDRAEAACDGRRKCGEPEYTQLFMVGGKTYEAKGTYEYNRHDKTYYYIEEHHFSVKEL